MTQLSANPWLTYFDCEKRMRNAKIINNDYYIDFSSHILIIAYDNHFQQFIWIGEVYREKINCICSIKCSIFISSM